jgi:hypothetical protein
MQMLTKGGEFLACYTKQGVTIMPADAEKELRESTRTFVTELPDEHLEAIQEMVDYEAENDDIGFVNLKCAFNASLIFEDLDEGQEIEITDVALNVIAPMAEAELRWRKSLM